MNQQLKEKFEQAFLEGQSPENTLIRSCLHLGADGEYFNAHTKALFTYFCKGAASVVVELPHQYPSGEFDGDVRQAIEAAGGTVKP